MQPAVDLGDVGDPWFSRYSKVPRRESSHKRQYWILNNPEASANADPLDWAVYELDRNLSGLALRHMGVSSNGRTRGCGPRNVGSSPTAPSNY